MRTFLKDDFMVTYVPFAIGAYTTHRKPPRPLEYEGERTLRWHMFVNVRPHFLCILAAIIRPANTTPLTQPHPTIYSRPVR